MRNVLDFGNAGRVLAAFMKMTEKHIHEDGYAAPYALIFPKDEATNPSYVSVGLNFDATEQDRFCDDIIRTACSMKAQMVVLAVEILLPSASVSSVIPVVSANQAMMLLHIEHETVGAHNFVAPIDRSSRPAKLGPWSEATVHGNKFTGLLPPKAQG